MADVNTQKADRWDALVRSGVSPSEATARVEAEFSRGGKDSPKWYDAKGLARQAVGQGALLGFGDEAEAAATAALTGKTYAQALKEIRDANKAYEAANPKAAIGAQLVGGLATGLGGFARAGARVAGRRAAAAVAEEAGALAKAARVAKAAGKAAGAGAGFGAAAGAGTAEGDLASRVSGAVKGAKTGAALGVGAAAAAPVVGKVAGGTAGAVRRLVGGKKDAERRGLARLAEEVEKSGVKSELLVDGVPVSLGDVVGSSAQDLIRVASTGTSRQASAFRDALRDRNAGARGRGLKLLEELGDDGERSARAARKQLDDAGKRDAEPLYNLPDTQGDMEFEGLAEFIQRSPVMQRVYARVRREVAPREGWTMPSLKDVRENGLGALPPRVVMALKSETGALTRKLKKRAAKGGDLATDAARASEDYATIQEFAARIPGEPEAAAAWKRGKDIVRAFDAGASGDASRGLKALPMEDTPAIREFLASLPAEAQEAARAGGLKALRRYLVNGAENRDWSRVLAGDDYAKGRTKAWLGEEKGGRAVKAAELEGAMRDFSRKVVGGSPTAQLTQASEALADDALGGADRLLRAADRAGDVLGAARADIGALRRVGQWGADAYRRAMLGRAGGVIADRAMPRSAAELRQLIDELNARAGEQLRRNAQRAERGATARKASVRAAGNMGGRDEQ